jgi:outer membrane protein assembly factor BamB
MEIRTYFKWLICILLVLNIEVFTQTLNSANSTYQAPDSTVQKIWEINNDTTASSNVIISNNNIFYTLDDGLVYCYDFSGNEKWVAEVFGSIKNNSVQYKDLVLTATTSGDLYSINSNNGDIIQVIGVSENLTTDLSLIKLTTTGVESIGIVFGTEAGNIYCYDIFSFELIWKIKLSPQPLISNPLIIGDKILFKDSASSIYCVNAKSGLLIWKYEFNQKAVNNNSLIQADEKYIYTLSSNGEVSALDLMLGKKLWSVKIPNVITQIFLSIKTQNLVLLKRDGELIFISTKDGKEIKKISLDKEDLTSFCYYDLNDYSLIALSDGSVYRIDDKTTFKKLLSDDNNIPIISIGIISENKFIISTINGNLKFYKIF